MKEIKGYKDYCITEYGKVWSKRNNKFLKLKLNTHLYYCVNLYNEFGTKTYSVHRLVAEAFIPNIEHKICVNHIDGIKLNNNISNLEWVTYAENNSHAYKTGLKSSSDYHKNMVSIKLSKLVLDNATGIFYNSTKEAAKIVNLKVATLRSYLNGARPNKTNMMYV